MKDAEEAVRLKRDGAKGYLRKGDALYALRQFGKSAEAYGEAVTHDPANAKAKTRRDQACESCVLYAVRTDAVARILSRHARYLCTMKML